ncbi:hypothetical protein NOVOSPHI9U_680018 [Novosphingobium sp. 9U]|nr:hypothetical protein NOVOSPHI9U_680018 [Novosphingobium sp. 9U]
MISTDDAEAIAETLAALRTAPIDADKRSRLLAASGARIDCRRAQGFTLAIEAPPF